MQLDATQADFMVRLGKSPDGSQLKSLLKAQIDGVNVKLRALVGDNLLREQGRAQLLDELLASFEPPKPAPPRRITGFTPETRGI